MRSLSAARMYSTQPTSPTVYTLGEFVYVTLTDSAEGPRYTVYNYHDTRRKYPKTYGTY